MTFKRFVLVFSCVSVFTWIVAKADAPGVRLVRQGGTNEINPIDEGRVIKWSHGAYLVIDKLQGQAPVFYTLNRDGAWIDTARFRNPEPTQLNMFTCDRQTNGTIVFAGQTETAPRVVSPFLAWTSADGQNQRMIRTGNYFPYEIAVAPDDTIWTLGYEMVNLDPDDPAVTKESYVLRHFDTAGNLISSALPQSQFNREARSRITHGLLVATQDRLGWYGFGFGKAAYTEISLRTITIKEYPAASSNPSRGDLAVALVMTNSGITSVCIQDGSPRHRTNYVLDRPSSRWLPVSVPPLGGFNFAPILIGTDGENLVFKYAREAGFFSVLQ